MSIKESKSAITSTYLSDLSFWEKTNSDNIEASIGPEYSKPLIDFIIDRIPGINSSEKYLLRRNVPGPLIVVAPNDIYAPLDEVRTEPDNLQEVGHYIIEEAVIDTLVSRMVFPLVKRFPSLDVSKLFTGNDLVGSIISDLPISKDSFIELYSRILFLDDENAKFSLKNKLGFNTITEFEAYVGNRFMYVDSEAVFQRTPIDRSRISKIFEALNNWGKYEQTGVIVLNSLNINNILAVLETLVLYINYDALGSDILVRKFGWIFGALTGALNISYIIAGVPFIILHECLHQIIQYKKGIKSV